MKSNGVVSMRVNYKLKVGSLVTITLDLTPETEAVLAARAQAAGLTLAEYLRREIDSMAPSQRLAQDAAPDEGPNRWEHGLERWLDSFPQLPVLADDALDRRNWYPDRW